MKAPTKKIKSGLLILAILSLYLFVPFATVQAAATIVTLTTDIINIESEYTPYMAADSSGNVYLTNYIQNTVHKYDAEGNLLLSFGSAGTGNGEFNSPYGITVDSSGNIFVVDQNNLRVQKFNSSGTYVTQWGSGGSGNGQFAFGGMGGIDVDSSGNVYVVDSYNDRIQKFDNDGNFLATWGSQGAGDEQFYFYGPGDIEIDSSNNIFISDTGNDRIKKYTTAGVYVSSFGTSGTGDGQFDFPTGISISPSGNIYVADYNNNRIQEFSNAGTFIQAWGSEGTNPGEFMNPSEVLYGPTNNLVYVKDSYDRIQFFDLGGYVTPTPTPTATPTPTDTPTPTPTVTIPAVTSDSVIGVIATAATVNGNVTSDGGAAITERGAVYSSTAAVPTLSDTKQVTSGTTGAMTFAIVGLQSGTHYYLRTYATNAIGTAYGSVIEFDTPESAGSSPTVTTGAVSSIDETVATVAGNVTSDGGESITERGIVFSSSNNTPTTANGKFTAAGTTGAYTVTLTGLTLNTTYYARAYAINSEGTSYGSVVTFKTLEPAALRSVYFTFTKFRYNKYASPTALRSGDTAYIKNYNTSKIKLIQVFLYDYAKKGNQGFVKSRVTTTSMFLRTSYNLATGKRYAYVMKFQDKATGIVATKYFVFYTTKTWNGQSTL